MKMRIKNMPKIVIIVVIIVGIAAAFNGCRNLPFVQTSYTAKTDFFYSNDKGHSYGNGTKEYEVGETVYMKLLMEVASSKDKTSQVTAVLTIPNSDSVDAQYMDGQIITPISDPVSNVTKYEFIVSASSEPVPIECVIQFKPNAVGTVPMKLVYDDNLDESYDVQNTLEFVNAKEATQER